MRGFRLLEDEVMKALLVCSTILFLGGCERLTDPPPAPAPAITRQVLVIQGFGDADMVSVGNQGYRLGPYIDFSAYDSLRFNFSAKRLALTSAVDHILIKIGPACYISDSLSSPQKNFSILIRSTAIAKSQFAAATFFVPDAETSLFLSQLCVIGWTMH